MRFASNVVVLYCLKSIHRSLKLDLSCFQLVLHPDRSQRILMLRKGFDKPLTFDKNSASISFKFQVGRR